MAYDHNEIEKKRQEFWEKNKIYKTEMDSSKPKKYILDMFPYPSGVGLHVGHPEGYTANDILARYFHANGYNVLHPMGRDAFGLPAENYAIKTGTHPKITTEKNISNFRRQIKSLGISYDRDREVDTTDPNYYKRTQWIFLKLFENGLAYEQDLPINYCPSCKTGLANEEVLNDFTCERCGTKVEKKKIRQRVLAITKYADRLLKDVDKLDWPEGIKDMQRSRIGKSEGAIFKQKIIGTNIEFETYNSVPQMTYADTFYAISPDHKLIDKILKGTENEDITRYELKKMLEKRLKNKYEFENNIEGIFTGRYIEDPLGNGKLPLRIANYVLSDYGTGIVKCSAHDERDFKFAKKYNIPLKVVLVPEDIKLRKKVESFEIFYKDNEGILIEPKEMIGETFISGREKMLNFLEKKGFAKRGKAYKLRDRLFSRQRYRGEPIPLIHIKNEDLNNLENISEEEYKLKVSKLGIWFNKKMRVIILDELDGDIHNGIATTLSKKKKRVAPLTKSESDVPMDISAKLSILEYYKQNIIKIKRKIKKTCPLKEFFETKYNQEKEIVINGRYLTEHIKHKSSKEKLLRNNIGFTIFGNIHNIYFVSELIGLIEIKGHVWIIILEKTTKKNKYNLLTYYPLHVLNKFLYEAFVVKKQNGQYLYVGNKEFSKIYNGINSKIVCDYNLPLELPEVDKYEPAGDGQSPLANVSDFLFVKIAKNLTGKRETNTMPQWGGSCRYYLRYMDPENNQELVNKEIEKYRGQVDSYVGGAEHAVLHLLYSRFWHKFLFDIGVVSSDEPFQKLRNQGLILAYAYQKKNGGLIANDLVEEKDGKYFEIATGDEVNKIVSKMSKSLKNTVNPDDIVKQYGADALRLYEMYLSEFKDSAPWDTTGIIGVKRFLDKSERLFQEEAKISTEKDEFTMKLLHKTIKKVQEDIENYKFNTAIAQMMILVNNGLPQKDNLKQERKSVFVRLLHPFAPHLAEELWEKIKKNEACISNGVGHNDLAKASLYLKYKNKIFKVKKKTHFSGTIVGTIKNPIGNIIFNSKNILKHFKGKHVKEFRYRKNLIGTVFFSLDKIKFGEDLASYIMFKDFIIKIILGKQNNGIFFVKTFYTSEKLTRLHKLNKEELENNCCNSVYNSIWPEYDEKMVIDDKIKIGVQVLGKLRGEIEVENNADKETVLKLAKEIGNVSKRIEGKTIIKEIYVPGKIVNIVVK